MSVIKAISAPFRLAKWCVTGNKLECLESAKRIGKLLKAEKGVWGAMEPKTNVSSESHRKGAFRSPAHPPGITL